SASSIVPLPTSIYTLSLHDALPISRHRRPRALVGAPTPHDRELGVAHAVTRGEDVLRSDEGAGAEPAPVEDRDDGRIGRVVGTADRKSTRLNSSHQISSYAVFCLKK